MSQQWQIIKKVTHSISTGMKRNLDEKYGKENWMVCWETPHSLMPYRAATRYLYERSYYEFLANNQKLVNELCSYSRIDSLTSPKLARILTKTLYLNNRMLAGPPVSVIYVEDSDLVFGPNFVPFFAPDWIDQTVNVIGQKNNTIRHFWDANKRIAIKNENV